MAQELYARTNQKLFFAGLSLESMNRAQESRAMNAQGLVQAEREATLFHLYGALLGLCHEIAGFYRLPQAGALRAEDMLNDDVLREVAIPEMAELIELAGSPGSWLAGLLKAYTEVFKPPVAKKAPKTDVTQPLIQAVNLDAPELPVLASDTLQQWRGQLKDVVRRFRDALSEC